MEQAFHGDFQVSVTWFFLAVSPVSLTELCSFWYSLRDLFSLHKLVDKAVPDRKNYKEVGKKALHDFWAY